MCQVPLLYTTDELKNVMRVIKRAVGLRFKTSYFLVKFVFGLNFKKNKSDVCEIVVKWFVLLGNL